MNHKENQPSINIFPYKPKANLKSRTAIGKHKQLQNQTNILNHLNSLPLVRLPISENGAGPLPIALFLPLQNSAI